MACAEPASGRRARWLSLDIAELRGAATVLLVAAVFLPLLPGYPGIPCALRTMTGVPCPLCGMSTGAQRAIRGDLAGAAAANPAAIVVLVGAALLLLRPPARLQVPAWAPAACLAALWAFQLWRFELIP